MPRTAAKKPTTTRKKPGRIPRTQAEAAKKEAAASPEGKSTATGEQLHEIPVSRVRAAPYNPRQSFDKDELTRLASSIKHHGLIQPIEVRADPFQPGHYEVVAGERRLRACRQLNRQKITCRIVEITDELQLRQRCVDENLRRADLNPIEKARALQILHEAGQSHADIARRLGYANPSQVTNELALLKLDDGWQKIIAAGQMPPTHARYLNPWRYRPAVMQKILQLYRKHAESRPVSQSDFQRLVYDAAKANSDPIANCGYLNPCPFTPTKKQAEELDIVDLKTPWGETERRAFNRTLWKQLAVQANAAKQQKQAKANMAEPNQPGKAKLKPIEWRVRDIVRGWLLQQLAERSAKLNRDAAVRMFLYLAGTEELAEAIDAAFTDNRQGGGVRHIANIARATSSDVLQKLPAIVQTALTVMSQDTVPIGEFRPFPELLQIADVAGIDFANWTPSIDTFTAYPDELLREIATAKGIKHADKAPAGELRKQLAENRPAGEAPPGFEPEALAKLK